MVSDNEIKPLILVSLLYLDGELCWFLLEDLRNNRHESLWHGHDV